MASKKRRASKPKTPLEKTIENEILFALNSRGACVWKNNVGETKTAGGGYLKYGLCVGSSDLIGIRHDGKFIAIEVKAEKGITSEAQFAYLNLIARFEGLHGIARSVADALAIVFPGGEK